MDAKADLYYVKIKTAKQSIVAPAPLYDSNGFSFEDGLHKDTGTLYDEEGYDKEGIGVYSCSYKRFSIEYVRKESYGGKGYSYSKIKYSSSGLNKTIQDSSGQLEYSYNGYIYKRGKYETVPSGTSNQKDYQLCRAKKRV